jgi:ATP-dependent RNA helicase SUPV3L1/SUV3
VLGPTNTGKTHYAIDRMLAYPSGMIGLPLRLLAREVFERVVERKSAKDVALVTGEEKIVPPSPRYWICTVEAMPVEREVDCLAVDEIQLAADMERGRIFTSRLLHARGLHETLFLGSETMRPILRRLFPDLKTLSRERFSTLAYTGPKKVTRLPRRAAVVGFSAETVYSIAELMRRQRGGAAVIMGALSPRTRNAQAALYQSGEVDYLVATDAIGMGLNMDVDHVAFAGRRKFDGKRWRDLRPDELAQIAGRAGRHIRDGTFGVTGDCPLLDDETVEAIENHEFLPVTALQWRSEALDFSSIDALTATLAVQPTRPELQRARLADDEDAFNRLIADPELRGLAEGAGRLELLWRVCETPDFRKVSPDAHARLIGEIFESVAGGRKIGADWMAARVDRLARVDGDIDAISARLAHVRTWTYLSQRSTWVEDAAYWQERTRAIEDSLSDALHEKLTQRFVDRRTSLLLKKLKDDGSLLAGVNEDGEVIVEGQFVGRLLGFEFIVDPRVTGADAKRLRSAGERALAPVLAARAAALANAAPEELSLRDDGSIWWRSGPVASLKKGPALLRPNVAVRGLDAISTHLRGRVQDRLQAFFNARIESQLGELIALQTAVNATEGEAALAAPARGVAFRLVENLGAISRTQFGDELKQIDQAERAKLRTLGVRFGEYTLFMPNLLKPAPAKLLTMLWALWSDKPPAGFLPPKAGLVSLLADKDLPHAYYYASGYRPSGLRAVRIDMLERLASLIRAARRDEYRGGFEAASQMMSVVGCSGEEFESILISLGYKKQTQKVTRAKAAPSTPASPPVDAVPAHADAVAALPAETEILGSEIAPPEGEIPAGMSVDAPMSETPVSEPAAADVANATAVSTEPVQTEEVEITIWRHAPRKPPEQRAPRPRRAEGEQRGDDQRRRRDDRPQRNQAGRENEARDQQTRDRGRLDDARPERRRADGNGPRAEHRPQRSKGPPHRHEQQRPRPQPYQPAPKFLKTADPNSPFAVLAALKDDLARQQSVPAAAEADGDKPQV